MKTMFTFLTDRSNSYLQRWHHRPTVIKESLAEHHLYTARIAYWLAFLVAENDVPGISPERVTLYAMFHDEPEVLTGDIPHATKLLYAGAYAAVGAWEKAAIAKLAEDAPEALALKFTKLMAGSIEPIEQEIVRYADDLTALAYLNDQLNMGMQAPAMLQLQASVMQQCRSRQWPWLQKLRTRYGDLP